VDLSVQNLCSGKIKRVRARFTATWCPRGSREKVGIALPVADSRLAWLLACRARKESALECDGPPCSPEERCDGEEIAHGEVGESLLVQIRCEYHRVSGSNRHDGPSGGMKGRGSIVCGLEQHSTGFLPLATYRIRA
jgi:hypothetical protein